MDKFIIKQYSKEERPILKGNGFDGLEIGEDREEAQEFIDFINKAISNELNEPLCPVAQI